MQCQFTPELNLLVHSGFTGCTPMLQLPFRDGNQSHLWHLRATQTTQKRRFCGQSHLSIPQQGWVPSRRRQSSGSLSRAGRGVGPSARLEQEDLDLRLFASSPLRRSHHSPWGRSIQVGHRWRNSRRPTVRYNVPGVLRPKSCQLL